ncbi:DEHA2B03388p [Debaryomyces hansenii CBS767]|uniref:DEHA2B03388p n=1 Tax=Debaryomyces hansenii (strain ATCC 36239 / CBS 767 / BCRC 21394 / JCM 1990 / NBRC 0083 / IGC 2968) TaxID=284592 RepID=Q6BXF7_DEBHA|nr:DEHA2B03388p [Debaryomyces hansenii CBS767]CAG85103.2 DEHA2B03388p [Debaryomyces hansenii CBS767]|eukprot:XP_457112.2 DEHA2B03388p [Debaryomyces hansenii CBS767]
MADKGSAEPSKNIEEDGTSYPIRKKPQVTVDDLYRRSTQYQLWSFTSESLQEAKQKINEKGRQHAIEEFNKALLKLKSGSKENVDKYQAELTSEKLLDLLTLEEELKYLNFYCENIIKVVNSFRMPTQVKATAVSFFKKFYLVNSVMEYHPKNILYTCVFLAAKSENYFMSIESFCKALPKTEPKDVLDLEFIVLQSLKFTLLVHHPFRPLYGFFLDFQAVLLHPSPLMYDVNIDTIGGMYDKAKKWLSDYALLSDVAFLFSPPQIALAAMYDIDKRITDRYLKKKFLSEHHYDEENTQVKLDTIKEDPESKADNSAVDNTVKDNDKETDMTPMEIHQDKENLEAKTEDNSKSDIHKMQREQYETLVRTIRKCIKIAKQIPQTSREESAKVDKKCFFALNPSRLLKKKLSKLTTGNDATPVPASS